ncbi:MAG: hypothetical protein IJI45_18285 [Anaerolineaceae bacterium]|nr:hypothetical protein [Anaerolineaceae bacterium]
MIVRGTTPTITYTFRTVKVEDIAVANLTIIQGDLTIAKTIADARVAESTLSWELTQEETLSIDDETELTVQLRYRTTDGHAYATRKTKVDPYGILEDGVI